ncbi:MAG TPA: prolyl oligopeptidase family serine peptidase [Acidimicrobiales bacterium]|nr:prolyl oligopeptidase family serine peptidase [Acidimicrobiales bacterium]
MDYPAAPRSDTADVLHGRTVPDPYRWLEDEESEATRRWQAAQDELLGSHRRGWTGRDPMRKWLEELTPGLISPPQVRGGRQFFHRRQPGQEHAVYWLREPDGSERPLVDPARIDPTLATVLDGASPSLEGDRLAYLLSGGGREESWLHVMDVDSGEALEAPSLLGRGGTMAWRAGGHELFCVRRLPAGLLPEGEDQFHRRVWRHAVGQDISEDEMIFGQGRDKTTYYGLHASSDGRWLIVTAALGTAPRNDVYLLDNQSGSWLTVQEGEDVETWAWVAADGVLYLLTNRDAPRWRLCRADPTRPGVGHWSEVLGEDDGVLSDVVVTDAGLVAVYTRDVVSNVQIHDRHSGALTSRIDLPGLGVASVSSPPDGAPEVWIGYADYLHPRVVLHHDLSTAQTSTWGLTPGAVEIDAETEQIFVASKDGTRVPAFIISGPAAEGGPRPTILYGYGGFNVALAPEYSALFCAWVAAGGAVVVANLRGGSEYGETWHRSGMRENKQNVFDDFLAVAEDLTTRGVTDADHLGIFGGSNGGLLVGAALTQRPELFRAVVCSAPLLDMIRYEMFGLGQTWNDEYGTAADPGEFEWLAAYSPYHHIQAGVPYPGVLFTVFEGDTRVDPLHARKMGAALQAATSSDPEQKPILIRRESEVGHGARAVSKSIELQADELGFMAAQLGLVVP